MLNFFIKLAYVRDLLRTTRTMAVLFSFYLTWDVFTWVMVNHETVPEWLGNGMMAASATFTGAVFKFFGDSHKLPPPTLPEDLDDE